MEVKEVGDRLERVLTTADGGMNATVPFGFVVQIAKQLIEAQAGGRPLARGGRS